MSHLRKTEKSTQNKQNERGGRDKETITRHRTDAISRRRYLSVALLGVLEAVELFGEGKHTLREHGPAVHVHRQLPLVRSLHAALGTHDVAGIRPRLHSLQQQQPGMVHRKNIRPNRQVKPKQRRGTRKPPKTRQ